jgi:hypothetical protein
MISEIGEYKGNKVITFRKDQDDKYPFSFGYAKAKIIVENIEKIHEFVNACEIEKATKGKQE